MKQNKKGQQRVVGRLSTKILQNGSQVSYKVWEPLWRGQFYVRSVLILIVKKIPDTSFHTILLSDSTKCSHNIII